MRRLLVLCFLFGCCAFGMCQAAPQASSSRLDFDPDHQQPVTLETATLSAEVIANAPDPVTGSSRAIRLSYRSGAKEVLVRLPFLFAQINSLRQGPAGRLIILGMATGSVDEIGILDTKANKLIDDFMCYEPAISPEGKYIAFTKFYPPHGIESADDHSMLYAVAHSPQENRPKGTQLSNDEDVGFEIYPPGKGNWTRDNIGAGDQPDNIVAGGYIWKSDDQYFFAYGVSIAPRGIAAQPSLVWVSIGDGTASIRTVSVIQEKQASEYASPAYLQMIDVTDSGFIAKFSKPVLKSVFHREDFAGAGSVDLTALPMGKPQ